MLKRNILLVRLLTIAAFLLADTGILWPETPLKFPGRITYKISNGDTPYGTCRLYYREKARQKDYNRELSSLKLKDYRVPETTRKITLNAYVSAENLSLCFDQKQRGGFTTSRLRLKEMWDFSGKKNRFFEYRETGSYKKYQVRVFLNNRDTDFLSFFLLTSHKAAARDREKNETFNLIDGRTVRRVQLEHRRNYKDDSNEVTEYVIKMQETELYGFHIYKNEQGFYFPGKVEDKRNGFELEYEDIQAGLAKRMEGQVVVNIIPFMEIEEERYIGSSETASLFNEAIMAGIRRARVDNSPVEINEMDPEIPEIADIIDNMVKLFLDRRMENKEKANRIVNEIMEPNDMEIIITGYYSRWKSGKLDKVNISPVVIIKYNRRFVNKNLEKDRDWYTVFCRNPITRDLRLCPNAARDIADMVKELVELY